MCYAFEQEYWLRRAEEVRREMEKTEARLKAKPGSHAPQAPAEAPKPAIDQPDPVPV